MNQIIITPSYTNHIEKVENKNKKNLLLLQFFIVLSILIFVCIYYMFFRYDLYASEKISQKIIDNYNITSLYKNNTDYTAKRTNQEIYDFSDSSTNTIGIIEIKKLNITYPILSDLNKDLLKISPCRFYGPNPNEIGNLCIAAHNYKNDTFFSKLKTLVNGDIITIYDKQQNSIDYVVYNVYTTTANDLECINQNTHNRRVVTLITCDSIDNHYRTIVKAREF